MNDRTNAQRQRRYINRLKADSATLENLKRTWTEIFHEYVTSDQIDGPYDRGSLAATLLAYEYAFGDKNRVLAYQIANFDESATIRLRCYERSRFQKRDCRIISEDDAIVAVERMKRLSLLTAVPKVETSTEFEIMGAG